MRADRALLVTAAAAVLVAAVDASGQALEPITVPVGSSAHLRLGRGIARVSVGASDVADVAPFPPDQLLVTGKRIGQTTATVWFKNDEVNIYTIRVEHPVDQMTVALARAIPDGRRLEVSAAGGSLVVTGQVVSPSDVERAERVVRGFLASDAPPIVNLLTVPGDQQVQLEVSFAEVSRTALKQVGLNFWHKARDGDYSGAFLHPNSSPEGIVPAVVPPGTPDTMNNAAGLPVVFAPIAGTFGAIFATAATTRFPFSAALSLLAARGYARTLSEPTLVAQSGQEASFLAGGEFPIPMPQALGQVAVEYKKFGVQLKFVPTVVGDTIQLRMGATVSDIDFSLGLRLASVTVPGLTERHSETTVRLRDGDSFAIAGLLSDRVRSSVDKVPGLGDLPVLGALFRSTSYRREETELLVVVTARLVRAQGERPALPGQDTLADPSDLELFFLGDIESQAGTDEARRRGAPKRRRPVGPVGFRR